MVSSFNVHRLTTLCSHVLQPNAVRGAGASRVGAPRVAVFDDCDTLYAVDETAPLRLFPEVADIFLQLQDLGVQIVIAGHGSCEEEARVRRLLGQLSTLVKAYVFLHTVPAESKLPHLQVIEQQHGFSQGEIMLVDDSLHCLQEVKNNRSTQHVLTIRAVQAMGAKGITPVSVLAPARYGSPVLSRTLMLSGPMLLSSRLGITAEALTAGRALEPCRVADRIAALGAELTRLLHDTVPVVATVLHADTFNFLFASDLIQEMGLHLDLAFLQGRRVDKRLEEGRHPQKWAGRDVLVLVGHISGGDLVHLVSLAYALKDMGALTVKFCALLGDVDLSSRPEILQLGEILLGFELRTAPPADSELFDVLCSAHEHLQRERESLSCHPDMEKILYGAGDLESAAQDTASWLAKELIDARKPPIVVSVLRAGFFFHADVVRRLHGRGIAVQSDFVRVSTYNKQSIAAGIAGSSSSFLMDLAVDISDRDVVLLDDSIARGRSMRLLCDLLAARRPCRVLCVGLLSLDMSESLPDLGCPPQKPFIARVLPAGLGSDPFSRIAGYGNDALTKYRQLPYIGLLREDIRDAIWAEDTIFGGIDWRLFTPPHSQRHTELFEEVQAKLSV